jgi:SnoaL-like domain
LQAWKDHDGQAVVETLAEGGTYVDPTLPEPLSGNDLKAYIEALAAAFPDLHFVAESIIADGGRVVLQWRMTGTNTGPLRRRDEHGAERFIAGAKGIGRQLHTSSQVMQILVAHHTNCPTLMITRGQLAKRRAAARH